MEGGESGGRSAGGGVKNLEKHTDGGCKRWCSKITKRERWRRASSTNLKNRK